MNFDHDLRELAIMYDRMMERNALIRAEVRGKYKRLADDEISEKVDENETTFAREFNRLREAGVPRAQLTAVIRTGNGDKYRRFVELGGGSVRAKRTPQEAAEAARAEALVKEQIRAERNKLRDEFRMERERMMRRLKLVEKVRGLQSEDEGRYYHAETGKELQVVFQKNPNKTWYIARLLDRDDKDYDRVAKWADGQVGAITELARFDNRED